MKLIFVLAFAGMAASMTNSRADLIPSFEGTTGNADETTTWTYTLNITAEQNAQSGDFFTIYDFGAFIPASDSQPSGWTLSSSLLGATPADVLPQDDPSLLNLTWTYNGPIIPGASPGGQNIGPFQVGTAGLLPSPTAFRNSNFTAQGTLAISGQAGTKIGNVGVIPVPIPEPSTYALIAAGLFGLLVRGVLRRRKA